MFWWAGKDGFATRGSIFEPNLKWYGKNFPPLALYSGGQDRLVLTEPLLQHLKEHEPDVQLVRVSNQPEAEHCDHFWAADAVEWCFYDIVGTCETNLKMILSVRDTTPRMPTWCDSNSAKDQTSHFFVIY